MSHNCQLQLTPAAIAHIREIMQRHDGAIGFRLSMKKYGCNGYGYAPEVVKQARLGDIELMLTDAFRFFVDTKYAAMLNKTEIDYVAKALGQYQLVFNNPNAEGACGCGESVNFRDSKND